MYKYCGNCGKDRRGRHHCRKSGNFCEYCGTNQNRDDPSHSSSCGRKRPHNNDEENEDKEEERQAKRRRLRGGVNKQAGDGNHVVWDKDRIINDQSYMPQHPVPPGHIANDVAGTGHCMCLSVREGNNNSPYGRKRLSKLHVFNIFDVLNVVLTFSSLLSLFKSITRSTTINKSIT